MGSVVCCHYVFCRLTTILGRSEMSRQFANWTTPALELFDKNCLHCYITIQVELALMNSTDPYVIAFNSSLLCLLHVCDFWETQRQYSILLHELMRGCNSYFLSIPM